MSLFYHTFNLTKSASSCIVILVDECTSGVDPLSRRALWRTLTTYRNERTIILTTHVRQIAQKSCAGIDFLSLCTVLG